MKDTFKRWFGGNTKSATPSPQLAVTQLLLEIARSDLSISFSEMDTIRAHLARAYGLDAATLDELITRAEDHVDKSVSLHETVSTVNTLLDAEGKRQLVSALWRVAYADQRLDAHEEALLRRLADLLYVPHSDFIREKLATQN